MTSNTMLQNTTEELLELSEYKRHRRRRRYTAREHSTEELLALAEYMEGQLTLCIDAYDAYKKQQRKLKTRKFQVLLLANKIPNKYN